MADEKMLTWGERLKDAAEEDMAVRFRSFGQPPYTDAAPGERLDALLQTWCAIVDEDHNDPIGARAERFKQSITLHAQRAATSFENALLALEHEGHRLIQAGVRPDPTRYIVTSEFPSGSIGTLHFEGKILAIAPLGGLLADHPYRSLVPDENVYVFNDGKCIVLGPCRADMFGRPKPRGWYRASQARYFSRRLADERREAEKKRREEKLRQEQAQEAAARADPRWHVERLRARVAELEREVGARQTAAGRPPEC
jgi:hypothetical protein